MKVAKPAVAVALALVIGGCSEEPIKSPPFIPEVLIDAAGTGVVKLPTGKLEPLSFPNGDQAVFVGDSFANQAVALAPDVSLTSIHYQSSNPSVASVTSDGTVTTHASGYVTITASTVPQMGIAESSRSKATSGLTASYDLLVSFVASAWVGEDDTLLSFSDGAAGVQMYRSSGSSCDIANVASCADGQSDILAVGPTFTDTALTTNRPGYYSYVTAGETHSLPMSTAKSPARWGHDALLFQDRIFVVGGNHRPRPDNLDGSPILSSADGINWIEEVGDPGFSRRNGQGAAVLNGKLFVIGGYSNIDDAFVNDVWSTVDGATWILETASTQFPEREGHEVVGFGGRLWLLGGFGENGRLNDVWSSLDGVTWELETSSANFPVNTEFDVVEHKGELWMIGQSAQEVWKSADGKEWAVVTSSTGLPSRSHAGVAAFEDKLWVIGGNSGGQLDDVYSSEDGITWTQVLEHGPFVPREYAELLAFDNRLWMIGGYDGSQTQFNPDIWSSLDGLTWNKEGAAAEFSSRIFPTTYHFDNKIWMSGGWEAGSNANDIWSSLDGVSWNRELEVAPYSQRSGHAVVEFANKLWLLGGQGNTVNGDVWSSIDGVTWTEETGANFPTRTHHSAFVHSGAIWIVGGRDDDANVSDIWSSSDGVTWTERVSDLPSGNHNGGKVAVLDGVIYLAGGAGLSSEVWTSSDGVTWLQVIVATSYDGRASHELVATGDELWIMGGFGFVGGSFGRLNDTWVSSDGGINWTQRTASAAYAARANFGAVYHQEQVMIIAGMVDDSGGGIDDVWASSDGTIWRKGHRTVISF